MKQGNLRGFGAEYLTGAVPPSDMPDNIVAMCKTEAHAISRSISFAKARFGYTQLDIAKLCGWKSDNHLSAYKRGAPLPRNENRWLRFAQVTGCNLLWQVRDRDEAARHHDGQMTPNERERAVLALMLRAAA